CVQRTGLVKGLLGFRYRGCGNTELGRIRVKGEPRGARVVALAPGMLEADAVAAVVAGPRPVEFPAVRTEDDPVRGIGRAGKRAGREYRLCQCAGITVWRGQGS